MRVLVFVLVIATSALGFPGPPPVKVIGKFDGKLLLDCALKINSSEELYPLQHRADDRCKDFPSSLDFINNVDLSVEVFGLENIAAFKEFSEKYGSKIKELKFVPWGSDYKPTFQNFQDVFNSIPNVEAINFRGWLNPITLEGEGIFNLSHLKSFKYENNDFNLMKFFFDHVPKDVLTDFFIEIKGANYSTELLTHFFENQKNIINLHLTGNPESADVFKAVNIQKFFINFEYDERIEEQKTFLANFIKAHSNLIDFDVTGRDYRSEHLDDKLFAEICKLDHLKVFKFNIDGTTPEALKELKNLKNLKDLTVKTNKYDSVEKFDGLSLVALPELEELHLALGVGELSEKTYHQFGEHFVNLKSLTLSPGVGYPINFFTKIFRNLESLKVTFGYSRPIPFDKIFEDDNEQYKKIKNLELSYSDRFPVSHDVFFTMRSAFPNLENFAVNTKFPFSKEFLTTLLDTLGKIKNLKLNSFEIPCNEAFDDEKVQLIKKFNNKLDSFLFELSNVVESKGDAIWCAFYENGKVEKKQLEGPNKFTFDPLTESLKNDFYLKHSTHSTLSTFETLKIYGGEKIETIDN